MFSHLELRTCQDQLFIDKAYEYVSCLWYVVAGDLSPLFVCVSVRVSCFRCVAEECIDVFRGPWEAHTGASCSFICCSWRNVARENSQTELSKGACHPHEVCVCMGRLYVFFFFFTFPWLPWAPGFFFFFSCFLLRPLVRRRTRIRQTLA